MNEFRLPEAAHIGFVHLRVTDQDRALAFYRDRLGFREIERGTDSAVLSASGGLPAHILLTSQPDAPARQPRTTGLYHVAIRLPNRRALARVLRELVQQRWPLQGAADHGVSEAIYLPDPDGNGLELYTDRPRAEWSWRGDQVTMVTDPLDAEDLLAQADGAPWDGIDSDTDIGHMHLQVSDLNRAEAFYSGLLGFDVTQRTYPGALFVAAGGYHHHLGLNIWAGHNAPRPAPNAVGLISYAITLPDDASRDMLVQRLTAAGIEVSNGSAPTLHDPDGNTVVLLCEACG